MQFYELDVGDKFIDVYNRVCIKIRDVNLSNPRDDSDDVCFGINTVVIATGELDACWTLSNVTKVVL